MTCNTLYLQQIYFSLLRLKYDPFKLLVVYDNSVTEAFVRTLKRLLTTPPSKTVYIALEKR
jgi:hypothetical protein